MWIRKLRGTQIRSLSVDRPSRRARTVELTGIELLDRRVLPAVTATFSVGGAILRVVGDAQDNTIVVSRDAAGTILVNDGAVVIQGAQPATVANTHMIMIVGSGGNDNLSLNETNGPMPAASIFGGDGNDVLTGGAGDDFIDGGPGNDHAFLGAGDDTFQWNPGNGSDTVDGQAGKDTLLFNGSDASEKFDISANINAPIGADQFHPARFTRDVGGVTMDLDGIEAIDLNPLGGADTITVNDQSATSLLEVNLDLEGSGGVSDGQADSVVINGTNGNDFGQITSFGTTISARVGTSPVVGIIGADGTNDRLTVNALGGNDAIDASSLFAGSIGLTLKGGAGNDLLLGGLGDDLMNGGDGNDVIHGGDGNDTLAGGLGNDSLAGEGGNDTYHFDTDFALGRDLINEAAGGVDTLDFATTTTRSVRINLGNAATQVVNAGLTLTLSASGTIENVTGGALGDTITGNALNNSLTGGAGNDTIEGGGGNDTLVGGLGNDTYRFDTDNALGSDVINESAGGVDTLDFSATTTRALRVDLGNAAAQVVNTGLTLTLSAVSTIENVTGGALGDTITGNALNNSLAGGPGNDTLTGGDGNDTLIGGPGADILKGGTGKNVLIQD